VHPPRIRPRSWSGTRKVPADHHAQAIESGVVTDVKDRVAVLSEASLLLAVLLLGTNFVAVKTIVSDVPPLPFVAMRFTLAGLLLLIFAHLLESGGRVGRRDLLAMAGVGLVGVGMNNWFFTIGIGLTSASETALIYATPPLWGMLLGFMLGFERPRPRGIVGVLLALLGVFVVVYEGLGEGRTSLTGDLLIVGGAACWGSYAVLALPLLRRYSPLVVAAYTMLFGGLAAVPLALPGFSGADWGAVDVRTWAAMAYATLLVAAFGFYAWQRGVSRVGANRVLVYQYLITVVGVTSGVVLLGEDLTFNKVLGGVIILLGVYLARRQ
jgi:drug/metabolite transporter (DMT)-like permease